MSEQLSLAEKIVFGPIILAIVLMIYLDRKSIRRKLDREERKLARARRRSEGIEHWSEVVNNDDWR